VAWTKDVICPLASKAQLRALDRLADRVVDLGKTLGKRHQHKAPSRLRLYAGRLKVRFWVPCIPPGDLLSDCYFCSRVHSASQDSFSVEMACSQSSTNFAARSGSSRSGSASHASRKPSRRSAVAK